MSWSIRTAHSYTRNNPINEARFTHKAWLAPLSKNKSQAENRPINSGDASALLMTFHFALNRIDLLIHHTEYVLAFLVAYIRRIHQRGKKETNRNSRLALKSVLQFISRKNVKLLNKWWREFYRKCFGCDSFTFILKIPTISQETMQASRKSISLGCQHWTQFDCKRNQ